MENLRKKDIFVIVVNPLIIFYSIVKMLVLCKVTFLVRLVGLESCQEVMSIIYYYRGFGGNTKNYNSVLCVSYGVLEDHE